MLRSDIIAAISTPPGKGGVAVIRVSGEGAFGVAERVFSPASGRSVSEYPPRMQIYGYIKNGSDMIDDGMLTLFLAGASYTGEETVEISCHGGLLITELVLSAVLSAGARAAEAGEFTRRAFLNGRLSLSDAEAIGLLLEAKSEEQIRLSSKSARGKLTERIGEISSALTTLLGSAYARIDYPDEDLGDFSDEEMLDSLRKIGDDVSRLLETYKTGHSIAEGISTAIVGRPNVGKSSVYNLLCERDAAIVTDIEGTTRDVLEEVLTLDGVMLRLADTAGIRQSTCDEIERIGIERSRARLRDCELLLAVFDASCDECREDIELIEEIRQSGAAKIAIYNKMDKTQSPSTIRHSDVFDLSIEISAKEKPEEARASIARAVRSLFIDEKISLSGDAVVSSARQRAELFEAKCSIDSAISALELGIAQDAVSSDVEIALGAVGRVDGRAVSETVVDNIFSRFCVGK